MNDILKYTSKDYNSIFEDLKNSIPSLTDLWTNTNDGDPGIVLVKLMSALGDMLSFNLDKQALEYYSSTVTQRKNAAKLFNLIGYHMKWYQSATNRMTLTNTITMPPDVNLVYVYDLDNEEDIEEARTVFKTMYPSTAFPQYYDSETHTQLLPNENLIPLLRPTYNDWMADNTIKIYPYLTYDNRNLALFNINYDSIPYIIEPESIVTDGTNVQPYYVIAPGESTNINMIQGSLHNTSFTSTQMQNNRFYFTETAIDENNMWLAYTTTRQGNTPTQFGFITKVENLLTVTDGNVHFEFNVDEYDRPYIELSSYWKNAKDRESGSFILNDSSVFTIYYLRTSGSLGNITANYITNIEGIPANSYTITHPTNVVPYYEDSKLIASPGKQPELPHEAYINSLNWVTTFNTLVTIYDFERFCKRQEGFTNAFAVDEQRAIDLNDNVDTSCSKYNASQLRAFADLSSQGANANTLEELRALYKEHKQVTYTDGITDTEESDYKPYQLQLHLIYGDFAVKQVGFSDTIAKMQIVKKDNSANSKNTYWLYQLIDVDDEEAETATGPIPYLKQVYKDIKVANVKPEISYVRVFPWRCCGTIHLKAPVTPTVANTILNTVMDRLREAFSPANLEFGKPINYMDVINVVTNAHEDIRYFDAGLGNRKLIDIDDTIDYTYFNAVSMMYYIQGADKQVINMSGSNFVRYGNNQEFIDADSTIPNPYYQLLSIAPEYISEA